MSTALYNTRDIKRRRKNKKIKKIEITNKIMEYKRIGKLEFAIELQKVFVESIKVDQLNNSYSSTIHITETTKIIIDRYYYNMISNKS